VSGRGQFVCHGLVVTWRVGAAPRDASSRWLIIIRTDLFLPTPTMIAVANPYVRGESDPLAELAQLIGQIDPFGTPAKSPLPLQSRANVRPQYALAEEEASAPAGPPPWRQRARQEAPPQQEYEEPEQPSPVYPLHRYAAPPAAASEQDHHEPQQDTDEQPADPSRYDDALYGPIKSVEQENARDPAYRDDPYAYQRDYEEEPEPRTRSGRIVTVAAVLATGRGGDGGCLRLSNLCWLSAQRRGRRSSRPTTARPRWCRPSLMVAPPRSPTACRRATAVKSWYRARKPRLTSIPGPARRSWNFRR